MTKKVTTAETDYPDWPLATLGASLVEGDPAASGQITFQTEDKLLHGGLWACSPGVFDLKFGWDEMAYLLEGELVIESGSEKVHLLPGDFFFSPQGTEARWIVRKAIKKVFFLRSLTPLG
jgi:uncharacterized cupin superfamily protein